MGFHWMPHLAADGVEPLWLAREYGYRGKGRYAWLHPSARSERKVQVWWVAWSEEASTWLPHNLRHALLTSVARYALGASPEAWDSLAVWEGRRTPRGRRWARENRDYIRWIRERGGARPDAEWWRGGSSPWAVEVDTGRWDPVVLASRARAWTGLYEGQAWVVLTPYRASLLPPHLTKAAGHKPLTLLLLGRWWEGPEYQEVL